MINLLPDEHKREIRAARTNVLLLRYNMFILGLILIIAILSAGTYFLLRENQLDAQKTIAENDQKASSLASARTAADEYRKNLAIASQIVDNGTSYTDIMISITKIMPDGVILDGLTLDESTATEPIMFRARAKSKDIAEELKHSFQASSLFTDVYFQNISQEKTGDYPFTINLSAKLNPKAEVKS